MLNKHVLYKKTVTYLNDSQFNLYKLNFISLDLKMIHWKELLKIKTLTWY